MKKSCIDYIINYNYFVTTQVRGEEKFAVVKWPWFNRELNVMYIAVQGWFLEIANHIPNCMLNHSPYSSAFHRAIMVPLIYSHSEPSQAGG